MSLYEENITQELNQWKVKMMKNPTVINRVSKGMQKKVNSLLPDQVHQVVTEAIKNMAKIVLMGSQYTTAASLKDISLEEREKRVKDKLNFYKKAAAAGGAGTGAGGIVLGLADFPLLLSFKMKFLFDTAALYGFNVKDYRERLFILYIFQLAFSSQARSKEVYLYILCWDYHMKRLPKDVDSFEWRTFQQEYRDYIDLAKLLQLVPGIGAVVGAAANYQLMDKLGKTAMNAYRLRILGD